MTANATQSLRDPLAAFMAGAWTAGTKRPVPLVATSFAVTIEAGLAVVETTRRFHNAEDHGIEATITFPLPVHATLFSLKARIGERLLSAHAESRAGARQTYETAIERGQSAVLHEEVLRGVHMLSVGHVPPGVDIEVTTLWATTVGLAGDGATLRIPLTVGDIYGHSALPDSDALVHGGPLQCADLVVHCADGDVELLGGRLKSGRASVPLDAPIDLRIAAWPPRTLLGRAADGREVALHIERAPAHDQAIDVAILVDRSGSMNDLCSAATGSRSTGSATKHDAVVDGLAAIAGLLGELDAVDLWEFDTALGHVGSTHDVPRAARAADAVHQTPQARLIALADRLTPPAGGTEIGLALVGTARKSVARDILLVTDGKSHALQVHALAGAGRRITVVLVGEDSLEAHVGHLAALTGGDIFVAAGADLRDVLVAALATLRRPHEAPAAVEGALRQVRVNRGGAALTAEWRPPTAPAHDETLGRAVAALAAGLALPCLHVRTATELAVAEGLVSHLTSLVLVDEAGATQEGLPGVRKVALPTPRTVGRGRTVAVRGPTPMAAPSAKPPPILTEAEEEARNRALAAANRDVSEGVVRNRAAAPTTQRSMVDPPARKSDRISVRRGESDARNKPISFEADEKFTRSRARELRESRRAAAATQRSKLDPLPRIDLSGIGATIDWDRAPNDLLVGDLSDLDRESARLIENAAALRELALLAELLGISRVTLVVALLAHQAAATSRSAARIAKTLLGPAYPAIVERVKPILGLS